MNAGRTGSAVDEKEYIIPEQKCSFFKSKVTPTNQGVGAAYLELCSVLEVVPGEAGVELHPVARDPGDLASPQL